MHQPSDENRGSVSSPIVEERRVWPRGKSDVKEVTLWTDITSARQARVHNESQTGIALVVKDASDLYVDQEVRLSYKDDRCWAMIRNIVEMADGKFRVGLEWGCSEERFSDLDIPLSDP